MVTSQYFEDQTDRDSTAAHAQQLELRGVPVGQIVIRPNYSMSWRAAQFFLATLILISFSVATVFLLQGYWMILFFSVLEMSVLAGCFYYCARRYSSQEVVSFSSETIVLQAGGKTPSVRRCWQRFFTKILVEPAGHPWYSDRVVLQHQGEQRELGRHLTATEKSKLIVELRRMVARANRVNF